MANIAEITKILEEKKALFLAFEELTEQMITCPVDDLEGRLWERERLKERIDALNVRLATQLQSPEDVMTVAAIGNRGDRGDLPEELRPVYDGSAAVRAVVVRLAETETQAASRLGIELQRTLETIKSTNRGVSAQAARFISAAELETPTTYSGEA